ncbi:hypothetical protein F4778DRAFT_742795, partial [Xylariomycetidae sp. FL2044]
MHMQIDGFDILHYTTPVGVLLRYSSAFSFSFFFFWTIQVPYNLPYLIRERLMDREDFFFFFFFPKCSFFFFLFNPGFILPSMLCSLPHNIPTSCSPLSLSVCLGEMKCVSKV